MVEILYEKIEKLLNEEKIINSVVEKIFEEEKIRQNLIVYITLTDNEKIREINNEYRKIDKPTDVLSFPMYDREDIPKLKVNKKESCPQEMLGDIIVSMDKVTEQANEYGHSFERELAYLVTHGMLHLLGFDHIDDDEQTIMRKKEEEILGYLNLFRAHN
jgi:probable rRNA maturation factor